MVDFRQARSIGLHRASTVRWLACRSDCRHLTTMAPDRCLCDHYRASDELRGSLTQRAGVIVHALAALTDKAAGDAIQGCQRQVQDFRLLDLARRQGTITPDQAQADRGMDIGNREPGGVIVGRVDERRGEGVEERGQDGHGGVLCRCADVVTGAREALGWAGDTYCGAGGRGTDVVEQVRPTEVVRWSRGAFVIAKVR